MKGGKRAIVPTPIDPILHFFYSVFFPEFGNISRFYQIQRNTASKWPEYGKYVYACTVSVLHRHLLFVFTFLLIIERIMRCGSFAIRSSTLLCTPTTYISRIVAIFSVYKWGREVALPHPLFKIASRDATTARRIFQISEPQSFENK